MIPQGIDPLHGRYALDLSDGWPGVPSELHNPWWVNRQTPAVGGEWLRRLLYCRATGAEDPRSGIVRFSLALAVLVGNDQDSCPLATASRGLLHRLGCMALIFWLVGWLGRLFVGRQVG